MTGSTPGGTRRPSPAARRACCTACARYVLQDDGRPDPRHALHLGRPGLPGRRPGARLAEGHRPGRVPGGDRRRGDGRVLRCSAGPRASSRRIESAHALAGALDVGRELGPGGLILVNLSGRGDKDVDTASQVVRGVTTRPVPSPRPSARPARTTAPPWSATCRPGSPRVAGAIEAALAMAQAGADVIEIGLPYSDPLMDGPVIAEAVHRALAAGTAGHGRAAYGRGGRGGGRAGAGHDLLEPGRPVRRARLRPGPGRGGRLGADHPGPHPRRGGLPGWTPPASTTWTGCSWSRPAPPTSGSPRSPGPAAASSTLPR